MFLDSLAYANNMDTLRDDLLEKLKRFGESPGKKILELGGGGGQFAVFAAKNGYDVTVIELVPEAVAHIYKLTEEHKVSDNVHIIQGDFYQVDLIDEFDVVCYWDGFGIGADQDQQRLLNRVSTWMKPSGIALIDIYTPWYWAKVAGQEMHFGSITRHYDFDANECRMIDLWSPDAKKGDEIQQSLRCYSPADLRLLMKDLDLNLVDCEPGGEMDYEKMQYRSQVPLNKAMTFVAKLTKN